jgi:DNA-binding response OmpR family regulator
MKVFLLEDNVPLAKNIQEYLKLKGIKVDIDFDGERGLEKIQTTHYDTLVLDINLPHKDGITICKELRSSGNTLPILMLTSRNASKDVIVGLDAGADDYLGKPFDMEELISRIHALTRRNSCNKEQLITIKNVTVNLPQRTVERS